MLVETPKTFTSKVRGFRYVTDQNTALLQATNWATEEEKEDNTAHDNHSQGSHSIERSMVVKRKKKKKVDSSWKKPSSSLYGYVEKDLYYRDEKDVKDKRKLHKANDKKVSNQQIKSVKLKPSPIYRQVFIKPPPMIEKKGKLNVGLYIFRPVDPIRTSPRVLEDNTL